MAKYEYITASIAENTTKKTIIDAYERNELSIVVLDDTAYYFEKCRRGKNFITCVKNEIRRLYPGLTYLYD